jgi:hypothetical protein
MRIIPLAICLAASLACGKKDNEPKPSVLSDGYGELKAKADHYCELAYPSYQNLGYVHSKCDGSGFTSLHSVACNAVTPIDLTVFSDAKGKLFRDPKHECFETGESAAESSKDMVLMRMIAAYVHQDKAWLDAFMTFATANNYVICKAKDTATELSRCVLSPAIISLLKAMQKKMVNLDPGEPFEETERRMPIDLVPLNKGFQAHLEVLRIWISGHVHGGITDYQKEILKLQSRREPENVLYKAAYATYDDGNMAGAIDKLLGMVNYFPDDRLPTSSEYCTGYLFQRDKDAKDWAPCERGETHSGTDFAFTTFMIGGI